jgi:hypothetical protein
MKRRSLIALSAVLLMAASGLAKETVVESRWTAAPVRIDGLDDEWSGETLNFEKGVKVNYALKNDGSNLYVFFVFTDRKYLSSIEATGLTIWVNAEGKKKKAEGFKFFKKQVTADELIARLEKQGGELTEQKKAEIKSRAHYVLFEGNPVDKDEKTIEMAAGALPTPPTFKGMPKGETMVYEFRLPLRSLEDRVPGVPQESAKGLKLGFEWGGLTKEMKEAVASRLAAEGGGGDESSLGSERMGEEQDVTAPGGGSLSARMRRGPEKHSFWVDIKLAKNQ